jgi:hypothetical protein
VLIVKLLFYHCLHKGMMISIRARVLLVIAKQKLHVLDLPLFPYLMVHDVP